MYVVITTNGKRYGDWRQACSARSGMPVDELIAAIAAKAGIELEPAAPDTGSAGAEDTSGALNGLPAPAPAESSDPEEPLPAWWDKADGFKVVDVRGAHTSWRSL